MSIFVKSIVAAAALVSAVSASAVQVSFDAAPGYYTSTPSAVTNTVKILINGVPAPAFGVTADEFGLSTPSDASFAAYCLDPTVGLSLPGQYTVNDTVNDSVARLFKAAGFNGDQYLTDGVATNLQQAALQLAIWEVSLDSLAGADLNSGVFSLSLVNATTKAATQALLASASSLAAGTYYQNVRIFTATEGYGPNQPLVTTVPEPSTYALMFACLGVVGLVARRKSV